MCLIIVMPLPVIAAEKVCVQLANGDRLTGEVVRENKDVLILQHPLLGELRLKKSDILDQQSKSMEDAVAESTDPDSSVSEEEPPPGLFGTSLLQGWEKNVSAGLKGEEGNDVSQDWTFAFDLGYADELDKIKLAGVYYYETDEREKDTSKGHLRMIRDWLQPESNWFYFAFSRYDYDSFKSWKHRLSGSVGSGYRLINEDDVSLQIRFGLGGVRSWGSSDQFEPEGLLGLNWEQAFSKISKIEAMIVVYPSLGYPGEFRTESELKWKIRLLQERGLSLDLGFEHEYESEIRDPLEDERHYDLLYFTRIGLDF